ncbi:Glutamate-gated chloride channel [Folsomia candida]|uniref:Glutamate-gated chloride channel n=1 Tax=Folsomia candida TaxID=158441 RepID=A0A226D9G7_FOLCA|nr:Glutamate-gated chloride channel [Folsomia candida]
MHFSLVLLIFTIPLIFANLPLSNHPVLDVLNGPDYSKDVRPLPNETESKILGNNATLVKVNIAIRKIYRIDDLKMEFVAQLTFRQTWQDHRLRFEGSSPGEYITLNEMGDKIWTPALFFMNEATSSVHTTFKTNSYKRVYSTGKVVWSTRLTVTFACEMDLTYFPFDKQICSIQISDYSGTSSDIMLAWDGEDPVDLRESKNLPYSRFTLEAVKTSVGSLNPTKVGEFSHIIADFHLRRHSTAYMLFIYLPTTMFVVLSWISFWLGPSISTRVSLTVTLLLTMTTQIQGANQTLPQVSYIKAVDVWAGFCMVFAVLSILETATVTFLTQGNKVFAIGCDKGGGEKEDKNVRYDCFGRKLDKVCRILFPVCFTACAVAYVHVYVY